MLSPSFLKTAHDLPAHAAGLLDFAGTFQPDVTLVCDTGAHPIGYALDALAAIEERQFPGTADNPLRYLRISRSLGPDQQDHILQEVLADAPERVMVVDDHIVEGRTRALFLASCQRLGYNGLVRWTTYVGRKSDYSAIPAGTARDFMPWRSRPEIVGVRYNGLTPVPCGNVDSQLFYDTIAQGAAVAAKTRRAA